MPDGDSLKVVFLPKSRLRPMLARRVQTAKQDVQAGVQALGALPQGDPVRVELLSDAVSLSHTIKEQEEEGADNPGAAYQAMRAICEDAAAYRQDVPQRVAAQQLVLQQASRKQAGREFDGDLVQINQRLEAVRKARALIVNETAAQQIGARMERLGSDLDQLANTAKGAPNQVEAQRDQIGALRKDADKLLDDAGKAKALAPEDGTARKDSHDVVSAFGKIDGLNTKLGSNQRDARGRTPGEDAALRLQAFDEHFAGDPSKDPKAPVTNQAMRLATVMNTMAARKAKELNDPHLEGRIGQTMAREYGPDLAQKLVEGKDSAEERKATAEALRIAQALLMDDPVGKLLTGKIRPEDAVQRIRDQATLAQLKPSEMMKLLRQQLEMKIGTMSADELSSGDLGNDLKPDDSGERFAFNLNDLQGEISSKAMLGADGEPGMVPFEGRAQRELGMVKTTPQWNDTGLAIEPMGEQVHVGRKGETLRDLAARYLGDAARAPEILEQNKAALGAVLKATPKGQEPDLSGIRLKITVEHSMLDELGKAVAAFDTDAPVAPDMLGGKAAQTPSDANKALEAGQPLTAEDRKQATRPTAKQLKGQAAKLKSPGETQREGLPNYVPAPGLSQDHKVRAPLDGKGEKAPDSKKPPPDEAPLSTGALNQRQYAHLRMLQRADEEEKEAFEQDKGMSVEAYVLDVVAKRYKVDAGQAKKMLQAATEWFAKVPLTVTFKADGLFSDDTKEAPAHGSKYKSEVEYSRTQESMKDVVGRDDNTKIKDAPIKVDKKGKPVVEVKKDEDEDKDKDKEEKDGPETVGVTGGDKGKWTKERGANYMRWRRDKDAREGRLDEMAYEDQQIFGAVNPNFESQRGTAEGADQPAYGANYYGDAHFLLSDKVRPRSAFAVRGGGISVGGGKSAVQRTDLIMILHDMIKGGASNIAYMDAMMLNATKSPAVLMTKLDWEVHLYGGFDIRTDAKEMWLSPNIDASLAERIDKYAKKTGVKCNFYSGQPEGIKVISSLAEIQGVFKET